MPLEPGHKLGPYEIVAPIGKGGMGEVYRARDTKLDREVAIKVLPDEFAEDEERMARFEREAKLLAALNHPNIAGIHGLEESEGTQALVLELVEGQTLAERIQRGPIPIEEAIAIAKQIAEALEAGHESGIVHRDLKPANVKLKEDGSIKLLDYGLAKVLEGEGVDASSPELSQSPTMAQGTQAGVILGTAAYMSPEQAIGRRVDKRADIWAFGVVLFEMLARKPVFASDSISETLASVLKDEPDWSDLPADGPKHVRELMARCLVKDPKERLRDIGEARIALRTGSLSEPAPPGTSSPPPRWPRALPWAVAGLAVIAALAGRTDPEDADGPIYVDVLPSQEHRAGRQAQQRVRSIP